MIGIIGLLATMTIPMIGRALDQAQNSQSISNLRQIGAALHAFAGEHSGTFPTAGSEVAFDATDSGTGLPSWQEQIEPFTGNQRSTGLQRSIFSCPRNQKRFPSCKRYGYFLGTRAAMIEMGGFAPVFISKIAIPSKFLLAGEVACNLFSEIDADKDDYTQNPAFGAGEPPFPNKRVNLLMADGHVESFQSFDTNRISIRYEGAGFDYN